MKVKQILMGIFLVGIVLLSGCLVYSEWKINIDAGDLRITYEYEYGWSDEEYINVKIIGFNLSSVYQIKVSQQRERPDVSGWKLPAQWEEIVFNQYGHTVKIQLCIDPTAIWPAKASRSTVIISTQDTATLHYSPVASVVITEQSD